MKDFVSKARDYSKRTWRRVRKRPLRGDLDAAWFRGYVAGLREWLQYEREMKKLTKTPCIPRKPRV